MYVYMVNKLPSVLKFHVAGFTSEIHTVMSPVHVLLEIILSFVVITAIFAFKLNFSMLVIPVGFQILFHFKRFVAFLTIIHPCIVSAVIFSCLFGIRYF